TLAACGDVVRTVTTVPAPIRDAVHDRLEADARLLGREMLPTTRAYHEIWVDGELAGYNFFLGGSHGMTHNNPATYPRLATPVAFVEPADLVAAAKAVVRIHRDYGDRSNRRHARLKYVIAERGEEWARQVLSADL